MALMKLSFRRQEGVRGVLDGFGGGGVGDDERRTGAGEELAHPLGGGGVVGTDDDALGLRLSTPPSPHGGTRGSRRP